MALDIYKVVYYYTYSQIKFCKRKKRDTFNNLGNDDTDDNDDDDDTGNRKIYSGMSIKVDSCCFEQRERESFGYCICYNIYS